MKKKYGHRGVSLYATAMLPLAVFLQGCRQSEPPVIAAIPRTTAFVLWESEHAGTEAAALKAGYRIYWNAPTREDDAARQIALINRMIDAHTDGLIIAPDQELALMSPVRRAVAAGIPTVILGSPLPIRPRKNLLYILSDEEETGRLAAQRAGTVLHGKGTLAVIGIDPDIEGIMQRTRSFETHLHQDYPEIVLAEKRMDSLNIAQAQLATEEILEAHPHLDALIAMNGEATRGAYLVLSGLNLLGKVKLIGCDQELIPPIRSGEIDSVIAEDTYDMGKRAVEWIAQNRSGGAASPDKPVYLKPLLVTKENMDSPEARQMLTMDWEPRP
ncbi:substrate-binding domain-containing protein [Silvibacterium acidisoli]|uniref:substrate-binding domain-containing protein n=1 Tax=Acidobacteriaceae bacterium ZG23-2 TaxID=2883246 RepID=UPI00406C2CA1